MLNLMTPRMNVNDIVLFTETANRSTEGLDDMLMSPESYVATAVVLFFIGFFGFFLNLCVIILMVKDKELRTPMNVIIFNLVCSDWSISLLGNPLTLVSSVYHHWVFGDTMCILYGFFMSLFGMASITTLTLLSFERYVMISRPFNQHHLTKKGASIALIFIWGYAFLLSGPPLFGWGQYASEGARISCSINWESSDYNTTSYIIFLFMMGLVLPVAVITFSYASIVITLRQNTMRTSRVSKAEAKVALMIGVMILAFLTAWTPYAILSLIIAFGDPTIVTPGMAVIPALMAKSSICYNPIIYAGLNTQFQTSWRKTWGSDSRTPEVGELTTITTPRSQMTGNGMKKATKVSHNGRISLLTRKPGQASGIAELDSTSSEVIHVTYHSTTPSTAKIQ